MLAFVNGAENCPGQGSGRVEPVDDGVGVRCEGEDDRDASFAGDRGGRQRADVGHPEMDRVDRLGRAQDPMDPALGGDPPRPRLCHRNMPTEEGNRRERVPPGDRAEIGDGGERVVVPPAGNRDDALELGPPVRLAPVPGRPALRHQGVSETYEQGGDATVVAGADL